MSLALLECGSGRADCRGFAAALGHRLCPRYDARVEHHCVECGYDLTGLRRRRGKCPECGTDFDVMSSGGLSAAAAARQRRLANRVRTLTVGSFTLLVFMCGGAAGAFAQDPYGPLAIAGIVGGIGVLATLTSYLSEKG